jgi:hypothetical protein
MQGHRHFEDDLVVAEALAERHTLSLTRKVAVVLMILSHFNKTFSI